MLSRSFCGLAAFACALTACQSERAKPAPAAAAAATSDSAAAASAPAPNVVTFTATDYRFSGPSKIPAGLTTFHLNNQGKELHHLVIGRLDEGRTFDSVLAALKQPAGPPPAWLHFVGGPNATEPGAETDGSIMMKPGQYVVMCFIPTAGGVPHIAKGMVGSLEVTPSSGAEASAPTPDVVVTLTDYSFELSTPLTPGKHSIRVNNKGPQVHELVLAQFPSGKSIKDLEAWEKNGEKGPIPAKFLGGIAPMDKEQYGQFTVTLEPGDYVLLCFVPDAKDGKPHLIHGMTKPLKIG